MSLLEVERPKRKVVPDPIVATKVAREAQEAFDRLAETTYKCTRAALVRACVLDCLKLHSDDLRKQVQKEPI
jgi:hypothetical protein